MLRFLKKILKNTFILLAGIGMILAILPFAFIDWLLEEEVAED